ncbi:hypothetical protein C8J57DRAFT_1338155 [Mycena rebaudengoi]|nr:hypothetical protein C8J57DRAFT_1338155 [Mycena rebaudengoi]
MPRAIFVASYFPPYFMTLTLESLLFIIDIYPAHSPLYTPSHLYPLCLYFISFTFRLSSLPLPISLYPRLPTHRRCGLANRRRTASRNRPS